MVIRNGTRFESKNSATKFQTFSSAALRNEGGFLFLGHGIIRRRQEFIGECPAASRRPGLLRNKTPALS
jgi:hypothetical protein